MKAKKEAKKVAKAEKKAATAYAMKLVGDFELGLAEEVRQERDARKFKNYEDNVEFDPDYDPRNEPAPWEPGGMGVQILIDFEIRKKKEAAERLGISPRTLRYKLARLRECGVALPA